MKKPSPLRSWKTLLPGSGSFDHLTDISYLNSRRLILGVIPEQGFTKGDRKAISHLRLTQSRGKCFRGHLARFRREKRATPGDIEGGGPDKGVFPGEVQAAAGEAGQDLGLFRSRCPVFGDTGNGAGSARKEFGASPAP